MYLDIILEMSNDMKINKSIFTIPNDCTVLFHTSRTAEVQKAFLEMDRYSPQGKLLEQMLIDKSGGWFDNYTCFAIQDWIETGTTMYISCIDNKILFGVKVSLHYR